MKALSVIQPWSSMIRSGEKCIETRTYRTSYRGDLLICASKTANPNFGELDAAMFPKGVALCIVRLTDCVPMTAIHEAGAKCAVYPKAWAWILEDVRAIEPFPVRGKLRLFEVDEEKFNDRYMNIPVDEIVCRRCKKAWDRSDLVVSLDIEYGHPLNKGKSMQDDDLHSTRFEDCPFCKVALFADGKRL